jgi:hypothetical protein
MSHFRLANFEPVLRPSYVIYERNDWHHRVRIACTNRVICQNFRKIFFKNIFPLYTGVYWKEKTDVLTVVNWDVISCRRGFLSIWVVFFPDVNLFW